MTKKLYVREITFKAYVMAEGEYEASKFDSKIVSEAPTPDLTLTLPVEAGANPLGWGKDFLVYAPFGEEITLEEAMEIMEGTDGN
jgi:hypothetical protein